MSRTILGSWALVCVVAAAGCASAPNGGPPVTIAELPLGPRPVAPTPHPPPAARRRPSTAQRMVSPAIWDGRPPTPPRAEREPRPERVEAPDAPRERLSPTPDAVR